MSSEEIEVVPEIPMLDDEQMNVDNESEGEDDEDDDHGDDVDNSEEVMTDASNNSSRSVAWTYFKRDTRNNKKATCNLCSQVLSLPTGVEDGDDLLLSEEDSS
ncbi:hypothetical protein EVAR_57222_1 [Eumeta japonica]|uniref:BED-type domain-containing protein n=1 Tax=Eumeta variegata TaxID=151549 RepID=A0A4C1YKG4_EUMVA|nr:hypothetical protein EVAR_57222_1 [Eumeta japonica]